jgi:hypothetical protein
VTLYQQDFQSPSGPNGDEGHYFINVGGATVVPG